MVEIYYASDEAVLKDVEIQEFVKDISLIGIEDKTDSEYMFNLIRMSMNVCM